MSSWRWPPIYCCTVTFPTALRITDRRRCGREQAITSATRRNRWWRHGSRGLERHRVMTIDGVQRYGTVDNHGLGRSARSPHAVPTRRHSAWSLANGQQQLRGMRYPTGTGCTAVSAMRCAAGPSGWRFFLNRARILRRRADSGRSRPLLRRGVPTGAAAAAARAGLRTALRTVDRLG